MTWSLSDAQREDTAARMADGLLNLAFAAEKARMQRTSNTSFYPFRGLERIKLTLHSLIFPASISLSAAVLV